MFSIFSHLRIEYLLNKSCRKEAEWTTYLLEEGKNLSGIDLPWKKSIDRVKSKNM